MNVGTARATARAILFLVITLPLAFLQVLLLVIPAYRNGAFWTVPAFWHRCILKIIGVTVDIKGTPPSQRPVFYVSNHISYVDIMVMGARLPAAFVAKSEIASWPIFGFLAKLQATYFIKRDRREVGGQTAMLKRLLARGQSLILFPEGTTGNGRQVLPFKASLFAAVTDGDIPIAPLALRYTDMNGQDIRDNPDMQDKIAWYGESAALAPHLWQFLKQRRTTVCVHYGQTFLPDAGQDRRSLANAAESIVKSAFSAS